MFWEEERVKSLGRRWACVCQERRVFMLYASLPPIAESPLFYFWPPHPLPPFAPQAAPAKGK
jgi:hypothetical protein